MPSHHTGSRGLTREQLAVSARACVVALGLCVTPLWAAAHAQDRVEEPAHWLALASAGAALRLNLNEELGQDRLAPAFADVTLGYVLAGPVRYRHGAGLGVSTNIERDGGYVQPIYSNQQLVLMPTYLGYLVLGRDWPVIGHVGLPLSFGEGRSFGLEVGAALGYRLLAGLGVFVEADVAGYVGSRSMLNVLGSLELGVIVDYEVLP